MWTLTYQENSTHIYDIFNSYVLYGSPELCPSKYNQFVFPIIFQLVQDRRSILMLLIILRNKKIYILRYLKSILIYSQN